MAQSCQVYGIGQPDRLNFETIRALFPHVSQFQAEWEDGSSATFQADHQNDLILPHQGSALLQPKWAIHRPYSVSDWVVKVGPGLVGWKVQIESESKTASNTLADHLSSIRLEWYTDWTRTIDDLQARGLAWTKPSTLFFAQDPRMFMLEGEDWLDIDCLGLARHSQISSRVASLWRESNLKTGLDHE